MKIDNKNFNKKIIVIAFLVTLLMINLLKKKDY